MPICEQVYGWHCQYEERCECGSQYTHGNEGAFPHYTITTYELTAMEIPLLDGKWMRIICSKYRGIESEI